MDILLAIGLRAGLLAVYVVVPGWAALRLLGFQSRSRYDVALAGTALGTAYTAQGVTVLLLAHVYTRATAVLLLLAPVVAVLLSRKGSRPPDLPGADVRGARGGVDRAILAAAAAFIFVYVADAALSPMTWWDGLASWGKWAPDWGRRTDSANYLVGGYPQLVPRFISVMYKLTGAHSDILPLDFFAAHVFYALGAAWFVAAAVRLSELLGLPAWPAVLAGLGSLLFREHIGAGTVDVVLAAQVTTLVALYVGRARGTWQTVRDPAWVLAASAFGTLFTKLTGIIGPLLVLSLHRPLERRFGLENGRGLRRVFAWAGLMLLPFFVEQGYTELRMSRFRPDPFEVNLSIRQTPALLATDADLTYRGGGLSSRPHLMQLRFWNSYDVPATLRVAFSVFLFGCLAFSLRAWFARAVLPVLLAYTLMWGIWSSYDQRNLFAALPVIGIVAALGAAEAWRVRPAIVWQSGVALFSGLFLVLAGGGLLKELQARATGLVGGPKAAGPRLQAIAGGPDARIDFFFPQHSADHRYLRALAARTNATHVLVTSPMFRFFDRGAHALSLWPYERVRPGDVFAGHEYHQPPDTPGWVFVRQGQGHRIWAFDPSLRPADVPAMRAADVEGSPLTEGTTQAFDLPADVFRRRPVVLWEAEVQGAGQTIAARYEAAKGVELDPASSLARGSFAGDTVRFSGVVAVKDVARAPQGPAVSVVLTNAGRATLKALRVSQ